MTNLAFPIKDSTNQGKTGTHLCWKRWSVKTKCESRPWALTERAESAESSKWAAFSAVLALISLKLCKPPPGSRPGDLRHFWIFLLRYVKVLCSK